MAQDEHEAGADTGPVPAEKPVRSERFALDRWMTAGQVCQLILLSCIRHFRPNAGLLLAGAEGEALHQARVALRRLRCALRLFRQIGQGPAAQPLRREVAALGAVLGEARDLDVLLRQFGPDIPAENLTDARVAAYREVLVWLRSDRCRRLQQDLGQFLLWGQWLDSRAAHRSGKEPARRFAAACLQRFHRRMRKQAGALRNGTDEERHALRKSAKSLRYACAFFESLYAGKRRKPDFCSFTDALEDLQDQLGALNDLAVRRRLLVRAGLVAGLAPAPGPDEPNRDRLMRRAIGAMEKLEQARPFWR